MAIVKLGVEAVDQMDLLVGELDGTFTGKHIQAPDSLVLGEQAIAFPKAADTAGGFVVFTQGEFLGDEQAAVHEKLKMQANMADHNAGLSKWTAKYGPWTLFWTSIEMSLSEARKLEILLKRQKGGSGLQPLLDQHKGS